MRAGKKRGAASGRAIGWVLVALALITLGSLVVLVRGDGALGSGQELGLRRADGAPQTLDPGIDTASPVALEQASPGAGSASSADAGAREEAPTLSRILATVRILVVDKSGPVTHARVRPATKFYARVPGADDAAPRETEFITDEEGAVTIEVSPRASGAVLFAREGATWAQQITWRSPPMGHLGELKLRLELGAETAPMQVVSFPSGRPLEGASVHIGSASLMLRSREGAAVKTDAQGRVEIPVWSGSARNALRVTLSAPLHGTAEFLQDAESPGERTVRLIKNARLDGELAYRAISPGVTRGSSSSFRRFDPRINSASLSDATIYLLPKDALFSSDAPKEEKLRTRSLLDQLPGRRPDVPFSSADFDRDRVIATVTIDRLGPWTMNEIVFTEESRRHADLVAVAVCLSHARVIAEGIHLGPGDVVRVPDQLAQSGPRLDISLQYADGRPLRGIDQVLLERTELDVDLALRLIAGVSPAGQVEPIHLPTGPWRVIVHGFEGVPRVEGVIEHQGGAAETFVLEGYTSVAGQLSGKPKQLELVHWLADREADASTNTASVSLQSKVATDVDGRFLIPLVPIGSTVRLMMDAAPGRGFNSGYSITQFEDSSAVTIQLPMRPDPWTGVVVPQATSQGATTGGRGF